MVSLTKARAGDRRGGRGQQQGAWQSVTLFFRDPLSGFACDYRKLYPREPYSCVHVNVGSLEGVEVF